MTNKQEQLCTCDFSSDVGIAFIFQEIPNPCNPYKGLVQVIKFMLIIQSYGTGDLMGCKQICESKFLFLTRIHKSAPPLKNPRSGHAAI